MTSRIDSALADVRRRWRKMQKKHRPRTSKYYTRSLTTEPAGDGFTGGFRLVKAGGTNLAQLKKSYPKELSDRKYDILRDRVADPREDVWLIVDQEERLCGFTCLAWQDHEVKLMRHTITVHPDQALFMDTYVFKKYRRRGAQTASVALRMALAVEQGRSEGFVLLATTNLGSTASFRNVGFAPAGWLVHLPSIKRTIEFWTPRPLRRR